METAGGPRGLQAGRGRGGRGPRGCGGEPVTPGPPRPLDLTGRRPQVGAQPSPPTDKTRVYHCASLYCLNAKVCLPLTPLTTRAFFPGRWWLSHGQAGPGTPVMPSIPCRQNLPPERALEFGGRESGPGPGTQEPPGPLGCMLLPPASPPPHFKTGGPRRPPSPGPPPLGAGPPGSRTHGAPW